MRVRLRLERDGRSVETTAVVNSGYEADTPQLLIPVGLARELGLWPPPPEAREAVFETAGGPLRVWVVPRAARAKVVVEDAETKDVEVDLVISPLAGEPLISDLLTDELGIILLAPGRGLWRLQQDPANRIRRSVACSELAQPHG